MTNIKIVSAPENPLKRPKGVKDKKFKLGDIVMTAEGHIGSVIDIQDGYRDRADKWHNKAMYRLNMNHLPGSPRVVFIGWELRKADISKLEKLVNLNNLVVVEL